jgi:crotonobetaine/carnitine-CoA ligase
VDAQNQVPDVQAVRDFQFAGQDIPWLLNHWANEQPGHPLLIWEPKSGDGRTWTYAEFASDVRRLAAGLHQRGITRGDKVLIHSENCPEMLLAWYACATVGAVGVTTNTHSVGPEITYLAEHARCVAAITQPKFAALVSAHAPALKWIAVTADDSGEPAADVLPDGVESFAALYGDASDFPGRPPEPMLPAGIMYTSGTTSRPKAVVHTHANALWASRVGPTNIGLTGADIYLIYLPFFHVNAQSWTTWCVLGVGGTIVLQPKFSVGRFWDVVVRRKVTHISLIPFVFKALLIPDKPANSLRVGVFGLIVPELEAAFGFRVLAAYGMTETVTHCIHSGVEGEHHPARSMGKPTPGYEFLVVNPDTGALCTQGSVGELWVRGVRGQQLFLEYFDNDEANASSFTADGWFKTGDLVRVGEGGNYFYSERDKDLLKVGGENVSAREVEDIARTVPGIAEIAVVGQRHDFLGEVPVAFVIQGPGAEADAAAFERAIIEACATNLADFKVPRAVYLVDEFPRATLDKIAKNKLRELADAQLTVS